ncbi:TorF family putative porin, partial [Latilactobacillus sakei subsp. carnosus]
QTGKLAPPNDGALILGMSLTSNYIIGGNTQTNNKPAFQPFIEYNAPQGYYLGAWGSSGICDCAHTPYGLYKVDENEYEYDIYVGYRARLTERLNVDLNAWRFAYDDTGHFGNTLNAKVNYRLTPKFDLGLLVKYYTNFDNTLLSQQASYALSEQWRVSGAYEGWTQSKTTGAISQDSSDRNWNVGISKQLDRAWSLDVRAYGANFADVWTGEDETRYVMTVTAI